MKTDLTHIKAVAEAINRIYGLDGVVTLEYPGFISIPERVINDDTDTSKDAWAVGPDAEWPGSWTGQLMGPDGEPRDEYDFVVYPKSDEPDEIASAVYCHGIGDLYVGGGCSDPDCPRRRPK